MLHALLQVLAIPTSTEVKVRLHVRSCDRKVCLFYYVQIVIGDFYYAQLCNFASARVRFDLRYAEIGQGAICDFDYARMQIEMYEPGY